MTLECLPLPHFRCQQLRRGEPRPDNGYQWQECPAAPAPAIVSLQLLPLGPNLPRELPRSTAAPMAMKTGDRMTGVRNKKYLAFLHNWPCMSRRH